jgi:GTPase SAR1 family protein
MEDKFFIVYGESQTGKTTFVNSILGEEVGAVGIGDGNSVTSHPAVYCKDLPSYNTRLRLMDCPGELDANLRFTSGDLLQSIEFAITKSCTGNAIDAILISESMLSETTQIRRNLDRLIKEFGVSVLKSVIVLGLKPRNMHPNRANAVHTTCDELSVPLVLYESHSANGDLCLDATALTALLKQKIEPFAMENIQAVRHEIQNRAIALMAAAPQQFVSKTISVSVQKTQPYQTTEYYSAAETYYVNEDYLDSEDYVATEAYTENVWGIVGHGSRHWLTKKRSTFYGNIPTLRSRQVTRQRPVPKTRRVSRSRTVQKSRPATKYRSVSVNENRTIQVVKPKVLSGYLRQASEEWENKVKAVLTLNVDFV